MDYPFSLPTIIIDYYMIIKYKNYMMIINIVFDFLFNLEGCYFYYFANDICVTLGGGAKPRLTDNITICIFINFNDIYATLAPPLTLLIFNSK